MTPSVRVLVYRIVTELPVLLLALLGGTGHHEIEPTHLFMTSENPDLSIFVVKCQLIRLLML